MGDEISALLSGAIATAYLVAGLYFFRFWKDSADRLFIIFALAFWLLSVQRVLLSLLAHDRDAYLMLYVIRLLAFVLIIAAIVDKNRAAKPGP